MADFEEVIRKVSWQLVAIAISKCVFLAMVSYLVLGLFPPVSAVFQLVSSGVVFFLGFYFFKAYQPQRAESVRLIHRNVGRSEYSLELFQKSHLNIAEQLQLERLNSQHEHIDFPYGKLYHDLKPYVWLLVVATAIYAGSEFFVKKQSETAAAKLQAKRALRTPTSPNPTMASAAIRITPPVYTRLPVSVTDNLDISAISGSEIHWKIVMKNADHLQLKLADTRGKEILFRKVGEGFTFSDRLTGSGLYSIHGYIGDVLSYESDYYKINALPDLPPDIKPDAKELYQYHFLKDKKSLKVSATVSDDFGVRQGYIIATVARGSGENVKFREVKFPLAPVNFKKAKLEKIIDLNQLGFMPGDELYYYWAAIDNRQPTPNFAKSDTYFVVYKDTAQVEESELATMAVNLVPEYFRSQRQIIIDTEKLLAKERKVSKKVFNETSNEIGFDQKVLRLRYGQYLGEEFETSIGGGAMHDESGGAGIVDAFTHHSDGNGEGASERVAGHSAEPQHGHADEKSGEPKDPLAALMEQYIHNHDDGEVNTFYEQSTRSLLKMALEQMWQSELHLRIYEPRKALPFEYKALEYLKSAQQKARVYVKKSGYDPPPIKEKEKRLTGEMKDLSSNLKLQKKYKNATNDVLASEILGYIDSSDKKGKIPANVTFAAGTLFQRLAAIGETSGVLNWSYLLLLQKTMNGKYLTGQESNTLKSWLYKQADRDIKVDQQYSSEEKLENAFWKRMK